MLRSIWILLTESPRERMWRRTPVFRVPGGFSFQTQGEWRAIATIIIEVCDGEE